MATNVRITFIGNDVQVIEELADVMRRHEQRRGLRIIDEAGSKKPRLRADPKLRARKPRPKRVKAPKLPKKHYDELFFNRIEPVMEQLRAAGVVRLQKTAATLNAWKLRTRYGKTWTPQAVHLLRKRLKMRAIARRLVMRQPGENAH